MNDSELVQAKALSTVIEQLPSIINAFADKIGKPQFIEDGTDSRFLYDAPNWQTYQVLKSVRLISGLRGAMVLLQYGHTIEASVLLRTIADFIAEITFAQDAIKSGLSNAEQKREFDQFFRDFKDDPKLQITGTFKVRRADRRKVQAAQGRYLNEENPHEPRTLAGAIDHVFSGYVHGSYSTIMEMYNGSRDAFDMEGMLGSSRVTDFLAALSYYVEMSLTSLILVAINLREPQLVARLETFKNSLGNGGT